MADCDGNVTGFSPCFRLFIYFFMCRGVERTERRLMLTDRSGDLGKSRTHEVHFLHKAAPTKGQRSQDVSVRPLTVEKEERSTLGREKQVFK